jgi:membrane protease YdiL (CAAX protease family)
MISARQILEILLIFGAFFLPGYLTQPSAAAMARADSTMLMLQIVVSGIPQILLMIYLVSIQSDGEKVLWGLVPLRVRDAVRIGILVAACVGLVLAFMGVLRALPPAWSSILFRGYRWGLDRPSQAPLALLFGLTAGYREEFFFRAYLLRRLGQAGLPAWAAVALSTALFGVGHVYEGVLGVAIAVSMGILFSMVYLRQRNLHVIALGHGLYNALALCATLLSPFARGLGTP